MTSINTPHHISEWSLSGLTPSPSTLIKPPFVLESPFSAECKLFSHQELRSKKDGERTATLVLLEVVRFHVWEDALGKDEATVDLAVTRPVFRAGGIQYGTCFQGFELPRPEAFRKVREGERVRGILEAGGKGKI
jgi:flavin reductase (DIM6/NTAB) family NADH-FMN oxidoreductase RutF